MMFLPRSNARAFEEATDQCIEALRRQLKKKKEKARFRSVSEVSNKKMAMIESAAIFFLHSFSKHVVQNLEIKGM